MLIYHMVMPKLFLVQFQVIVRQIRPAPELLAVPTIRNMHLPCSIVTHQRILIPLLHKLQILILDHKYITTKVRPEIFTEYFKYFETNRNIHGHDTRNSLNILIY